MDKANKTFYVIAVETIKEAHQKGYLTTYENDSSIGLLKKSGRSNIGQTVEVDEATRWYETNVDDVTRVCDILNISFQGLKTFTVKKVTYNIEDK